MPKTYFATFDEFKCCNSLSVWLEHPCIQFEGVGYITKPGNIYVDNLGSGYFEQTDKVNHHPVVEVYSIDTDCSNEPLSLFEVIEDLFGIGLSNETYEVKLFKPQIVLSSPIAIITELIPLGIIKGVKLLQRKNYDPTIDTKVNNVEHFKHDNINVVYYGNFNELDSAEFFEKQLFKQRRV